MAKKKLEKAYKEGTEAWEKGIPNNENPYPQGGVKGINPDRYQWFMGWYDKKFSKYYAEDKE